jgi:hypothetical protein
MVFKEVTSCTDGMRPISSGSRSLVNGELAQEIGVVVDLFLDL